MSSLSVVGSNGGFLYKRLQSMSNQYKGYFRSVHNNTLYSVSIIPTGAEDSSVVEITMAGDNPFIVTYTTSNSLFEPVRISTASISIVCNSYLMDAFSPYATGTQVILKNEITGVIEWKGYLRTNLYDQSYEAEYETIQLEASDCLSSLQYFKYTPIGDKKSVVTFNSIIQHLMDKCGIDMYLVTIGKKINNANLALANLRISEENFFSSDTDEGWKLNEVLEEICRYLGYTAIQWRNTVILLDYVALAKKSSLSANGYRVVNGDWMPIGGTIPIGQTRSVDSTSYMLNGGSISFDTIVNKAVVNCSTYNIEEFIPDIWDDDNCHNRKGDWYNCSYISASGKKKYLSSNEKIVYEADDADDNKKTYVHRILDNKYYESTYYRTTDMAEQSICFDVVGSTVSVVKNALNTSGRYSFTNNGETSHTITIYTSISIHYVEDRHSETETETETVTLEIGPGETKEQQFYISIDDPHKTFHTSYSYEFMVEGDTTTHSIGGKSDDEDKTYVGGTLVDFESYDKMSQLEYNYEPTASLSFTRYLMLNQYCKPTVDWFYAFTGTTPDLTSPTDIDYSKHPKLFSLKEGYSKPIVCGDGSYICLNTQAICQRYTGTNHINDNWDNTATGLNDGFFYNIFHMNESRGCGVSPLRLIFKLGIGNKFWNGTAWTTTNTCFSVPMNTMTDENDKADMTKIWNTSFHVLNNFSWEEWTGGEGYRIPIDNTVDLSKEITFEVHLPTKMQFYYNRDDSDKNNYGKTALNGSTWLSNLSLTIVSKEQQIEADEDIVYENIIDDDSINEIDEITCKINTFPGKVPLSYSFVGLSNGSFLDTIEEYGATSAQKPEENLIEKMVNQYSTETRKETLNLNLNYTPFDRIRDNYWGDDDVFYMAVLGQEINYATETQSITMIELK